MDEKFRSYLQDCGLAEMSVNVYLRAVRMYHSFYCDVGFNELAEFRQHLISTYNVHTANLYIIGINRYLVFLGKERWKLKVVKVQQSIFIDNVLSNEQYELLKHHLDNDRYRKWFYVIWTLASTGARVSELVQFRIEHAEAGYMDIRSKGDKQRRIYLPKTLQESLLQWCKDQHRYAGHLFINRTGHAISKRGIAKGLEHAARLCGIEPRLVHPHAFRHLFAKNFLSHHNDLTLLADLLGHESLETTKIYLRYTMNEQRDIINRIVRW